MRRGLSVRGIVLVAAASLLLAGCESIGSYWDGSSDPSPASPAVVVASAAPPAARELICRDTALKRAGDAAAQDFDEAVQQAVYQGTYADCLKWDSRR